MNKKTICLNCKAKYKKELFLFDYCPNCKGKNLKEEWKKMIRQEQIKKYSLIYDALSDLKEDALKGIIEEKLNKAGYKIKVVRDKYKFVWVK